MQITNDLLNAILKQYQYDEIPKSFLQYVKTDLFDDTLKRYNHIVIDDNKDAIDAARKFFAEYKIAKLSDEERGYIEKTSGVSIKNKNFKLPKGIMFFGNCGTGKTRIAMILAVSLKIEFFEASEIASHYLAYGDEWYQNFVNRNRKKTIVIDDVGIERDVKRFGNNSIIKEFLASRAMSWEWYNVPTIATTNFAEPNEIADRYGKHIESRFFGAFNHIALTGSDWRKF
jgi:DNA replication protein DnaC